jgi:hypothetical protein
MPDWMRISISSCGTISASISVQSVRRAASTRRCPTPMCCYLRSRIRRSARHGLPRLITGKAHAFYLHPKFSVWDLVKVIFLYWISIPFTYILLHRSIIWRGTERRIRVFGGTEFY